MADSGPTLLLSNLARFGVEDSLPVFTLCGFTPPPPPPDTTLPVVGNFVPTPGTAIASTQPVSFDVTDLPSGNFCRILVLMFFATNAVYEVVHDGVSFAPLYNAGSTRSVITNGFHYALLRSGGWPGPPTARIFAIDAAGNESI